MKQGYGRGKNVQEAFVPKEHGSHGAFAPEPDRVRERGDCCCVAW
jgi:hypothetical protein